MPYFFEAEVKDFPHRLIKKKRTAQLIYEKLGENQHIQTMSELLTQSMKPHDRTCSPPNSINAEQPQSPTIAQHNGAIDDNTSTKEKVPFDTYKECMIREETHQLLKCTWGTS